MPKSLSLDLRYRIVQAYLEGGATYEQIAQRFRVSPATVSRLMRAHREREGDLAPKPHAGGQRRRIDLEWLRSHARAHPDATLAERVEAHLEHGGVRVCLSAMSAAMRAIGWTYKKKHPARASETARTWSKSASASSASSPRSSSGD